jgi:urate oxidase / 2-oxo-4-hydroxy-4-carboxy-5-ureidoimidazoline decarboxylase
MSIHYGKAAVPLYRTDGVRTLFGAEVEIDVFGENFMPAYREGDNSLVVPTDTMKNFVHGTALEFDGSALDDFLELLGRRFLGSYGHVERIRVSGRELAFARESDVLFRRLHDDYGVAELELDRTGMLDHRSGRRALHLIKITGSAFADFPRDEHTTLPEMVDRPLFVYLDALWRHADFHRRVPSEDVRASLIATFDDFVSNSIQHLVHEMGRRLLAQFAELAEVSFEAQNRLWDTAEVSEGDPKVKVYTDPRPPYGVIGLTLARSREESSRAK